MINVAAGERQSSLREVMDLSLNQFKRINFRSLRGQSPE